MKETQKASSLVANVESMIEFASDGIVSKTIAEQSCCKVVVSCMSSGQSLSEHTASSAAAIQILQGRGKLQLGEESCCTEPGVWIYMPPDCPHAVQAEKDLVFLLTLFPS